MKPANTGDVVAPSIFFHKHLASRTSLPVHKGFLKVNVTWTLVFRQLAFFAELFLAFIALHFPSRGVDNSFAECGGAHSKVGVAHGLFPQKHSLVPLLGSFRQFLKDSTLYIDALAAVFLRAGDFLHHPYFIVAVFLQANHTEPVHTSSDAVHVLFQMDLLAQTTSGTQHWMHCHAFGKYFLHILSMSLLLTLLEGEVHHLRYFAASCVSIFLSHL